MEKQFKNYKEYYIDTKTWRESHTIKTIKEILQTPAEQLKSMEEWEKSRKAEYLTDTQAKALYNNDVKRLKELLKRYKTKAIDNLKQAKEKAIASYNEIKALKDIKSATFEIVWSKSRGLYGYQCKCISYIRYANGESIRHESESTGGCGYDKPSSALSYNLNDTAKILLLKHFKKVNNDTDRHYNYYAIENSYFSYGVGISSYETMFKNLGYKTKVIYHPNEDITITIEK